MQTMPDGVDFAAVNENVLTTVVRLMHEKTAAHLAQALLDALAVMDEANTAANKLRNPYIIANAWMEIGQGAIVADISTLEIDAERVVNRNVKLEPYHSLFGEYHVKDHRTMAPEELKNEVNRKIGVINELPDDSILRAHVPVLKKLLRDWAPLVKDFETAKENLDAGNAKVDAARQGISDQLFTTHGDLEKLYPGKKTVVEAFFVPWTTPRKPHAKPAPAPAPQPAPNPPPSTTKGP